MVIVKNPPKNAIRLWSLTIPKSAISVEQLHAVLGPIGSYAFSEEEGASGYRHYQGVLRLNLRTTQLYKVLTGDHSQWYAQPAHSNSALQEYVRKETDKDNLLIQSPKKLDYVQRSMHNRVQERGLKRWQQEALYYIDYLQEYGDGRKVIYIYSEAGGTGKTEFLRILHSYTEFKYPTDFQLIPRGSQQSMMNSLTVMMKGVHESRKKLLVCIPLGRYDTMVQENHSDSRLLSMLVEQICDGISCSTMYGKTTTCFLRFNTCTPIILCNEPPNQLMRQLSRDRVSVLHIFNSDKHIWQI